MILINQSCYMVMNSCPLFINGQLVKCSVLIKVFMQQARSACSGVFRVQDFLILNLENSMV